VLGLALLKFVNEHYYYYCNCNIELIEVIVCIVMFRKLKCKDGWILRNDLQKKKRKIRSRRKEKLNSDFFVTYLLNLFVATAFYAVLVSLDTIISVTLSICVHFAWLTCKRCVYLNALSIILHSMTISPSQFTSGISS